MHPSRWVPWLLLTLALIAPRAGAAPPPPAAPADSVADKKGDDEKDEKDKKDKKDKKRTGGPDKPQTVKPSTAAGTRPGGMRRDTKVGPSDLLEPPTPLSKVLLIDQQRVHFLEAGWDQHEVLIVLPGFPEPALAGQAMLETLSKRFRVIVVDPQGFGFSGGPNWVDYSPQGMAQFLLRLMDHQEIAKAHIAGFDLGAAAALRFAYDNPDRVHSVIVGAGPVFPESYTGLLADAQVPITGDAVFSGLKGKMKSYVREGLHDPTRYDEQTVEDLYTFFDDRETRDQLRDWINTTGRDLYQMEKWYETIEKPVFIVWGKSDPYFPVAQADDLVHRFPDARLKVVDEAGHFLLLEQPREVAMALVEYVWEPPPPPPPFSGLGFTAYRGQTCSRYFVLINHQEDPVQVTVQFAGEWTDETGATLEVDNVEIDPAEEIEIEPGASVEVSVLVSMADRSMAVDTLYMSALTFEAKRKRDEIEVLPLPIRLQIPQLGETMPEGFEAKPMDQVYEVDIGEPPVDEMISIE